MASNTNVKSADAGYIIDVTLAEKNPATVEQIMNTLAKFCVTGCKITSHQAYKIDAMVKARNLALLAFGYKSPEDAKKDEEAKTTDLVPTSESANEFDDPFSAGVETKEDATDSDLDDVQTEEGGERDDS